jgi:transposase InsO family protein
MPGSPWENGSKESFKAWLCDELFNKDIFYSLAEARIIVERWRRHYNTVRSQQSLDYWPPAQEVFVPVMGTQSAPKSRPAPLTAVAPKTILP